MNKSKYRLQPGNCRQQFADFLDRLGKGTVELGEWSSFVVTHYNDELVEEYRRCTARIGCGYTDIKLDSDSGREMLRVWANELRSSYPK